MTAALTKLAEGQALYFVPSNQYRNHETVTVLRVGRKWAELSNRYRINLKTMETDGAGYVSPGRAWPSKDAFDAAVALNSAWTDLRNDIYKLRGAPTGITIDAINELRRSIGLEVVAISSKSGDGE